MLDERCNCDKKAYCVQLKRVMCIHDIREYYQKNPNDKLDFVCSTSNCRKAISVVNPKKPEKECKKEPHLKSIKGIIHLSGCPFEKKIEATPNPSYEQQDTISNTQTNFKLDDIIDVFKFRPNQENTNIDGEQNSTNTETSTERKQYGHSTINSGHHNKNHSQDFVRLVANYLLLKEQKLLKTRMIEVPVLGVVSWYQYFSPLFIVEKEHVRCHKVSFANIREVKKLDGVYSIDFWHKSGQPSHTLYIKYSFFQNKSRHQRLKDLLDLLSTQQVGTIHQTVFFYHPTIKVKNIEGKKARKHFNYYINDISYLLIYSNDNK